MVQIQFFQQIKDLQSWMLVYIMPCLSDFIGEDQCGQFDARVFQLARFRGDIMIISKIEPSIISDLHHTPLITSFSALFMEAIASNNALAVRPASWCHSHCTHFSFLPILLVASPPTMGSRLSLQRDIDCMKHRTDGGTTGEEALLQPISWSLPFLRERIYASFSSFAEEPYYPSSLSSIVKHCSFSWCADQLTVHPSDGTIYN